MKNVFCNICGSAYSELETNCPICGSSRDFTLDGLEEELLTEELYDEIMEPQSGRGSREIFDYDEVNPESDTDYEEPTFYDEEDEGRQGDSNVVLVVILVILIVLLLGVAAFMYLRFFLPNAKEEPVETTAAVTTMPVEETQPTETTEDPGIPCSDIVMEGGRIELGESGKWLLNVKVYPADTTDVLTYASADENVAVVSDSGTLTAVGEGETTITISCGDKQIKCSVLVDYSLTAEETEEGTLPGLEVEEDSTAAAEETQGENAEETKPEETTDGEKTFALVKSDITIFSNHTSVRLELEGGIDPANVKWLTLDSTVAICHEGVVTSTGSGVTRIIGEYQGQKVECVVRCDF